MSVCGLALNAFVPIVPSEVGAVIHSLVGLALVWSGRYAFFEQAMKLFVGQREITMENQPGSPR